VETLNLSGLWQATQSTVSPLPILLIKLRCSLKEFAVDLLIAEKSNLAIIITMVVTVEI
jgi:hypothetical protein